MFNGSQNLSLLDKLTSVKAYLATTGIIFGLIAVMHLLKGIADWDRLATQPGEYLSMAALGVVAATLSAWAWLLLRQQGRS